MVALVIAREVSSGVMFIKRNMTKVAKEGRRETSPRVVSIGQNFVYSKLMKNTVGLKLVSLFSIEDRGIKMVKMAHMRLVLEKWILKKGC